MSYFPRVKATTPSQRSLLRLKHLNILRKPLLKKNNVKGFKKDCGRNNKGVITTRHKGGGHKKRYRKINFSRNENSTSIVTSIEYDPNRSSLIASTFDLTKKTYEYILSPKNLRVGDLVKSGNSGVPKLGHSYILSGIPVGSYTHNVSTRPKKEGTLARSAGTFARISKKTHKRVTIILKSGEKKVLKSSCRATLGIVSNENFSQQTVGKAGRSRWVGVRPTVRGVAMNPIDHPHGGGEGKKSGKPGKKSPWG